MEMMLKRNICNITITKHHKRRALLSTVVCFSLIATLPSIIVQKGYAAVTTNADYEIEQIEINTDEIIPTQKPQVYQPQTLDTATPEIPTNTPKFTITSTSDAYSITNSQTAIDFGALSATNPVIRTSDLTIISPLQGAQIMANEDRPMTATNKQFVPDTTCDNGSCTAGLAALWESSLTYGFGYRCDSEKKDVCDTGFTNPNTYKKFADASANESFHTIMRSQPSQQQTTGKVTYKVNISGTQPLGGYRNTITFIAVPNF